MNLNVCIVEDSKVDSDVMKTVLKNYFEDKHFNYSIKTYDTGVEFFDDYKDGYICPTTLFIRIVLPNSNGLDICKKLREDGFMGDIVFVTDKPEYAIDAFSVDARGYILKPYSPQHVFEVLDRVTSFSSLQTIAIKIGRQFIKVPIFGIMYIESCAHDCVFHCRQGSVYTSRCKLDDVQADINNSKFIRCHKSYLVNMNYVQSISPNEFIMSDGSAIPITKKDSVMIKDIYERFKKGD